jgi:hypothetical protein
MYIELNNDGKITNAGNFKFSDKAIKTDREIVYLNGKNYFKDEVLDLLLDSKKHRLIADRKVELENLFYDKYPLHKQNNLAIFGTLKEKNDFKKFYYDRVNEFDEFEARVNECRTEQELDEILKEPTNQ